MKIHLIRHGRTDWNAEGRCQGQSESQLDEVGISQATSARGLINALSIDSMYVSPLRRTRQTADLLAADLDVPSTYLSDLREIGLGPWENRLWVDIEQEEPSAVSSFRSRPDEFYLEGAETYSQVQQRGVACIEQIIAAGDGLNVLVVSHGAILKTILHHYDHIPLAKFAETPGLGNCSHSILSIQNAGSSNEVQVIQTGADIV